jgi:diguanylate cyclase (GGDEF)-like protein
MPESINDLLHLTENSIYREDDQKKALEYLEAALRIDKNSLKAYMLRGVAELRSGLFDEALSSCQKVLKLDESNAEAQLNMAVVHICTENYAKAQACVDIVLAQQTNGDALEILGDMSLLQEHFEEGSHFYSQAMELKPSDAHVYFKKSICHYKLKQFKECYKYAELSAELNPGFEDAALLSETAADIHVYSDLGFFAKIFMRPLRPYLKKQLKEQIQVHDEMFKIQKKTEELSVDPLMKIRNRSYFENTFNKMCENAKQKKQNLALLFFDLDNMKIFNEVFGHPVLDKILSMLGEIFNASIRSSDLVARYAGDEIVLALQNCDKPGAHAVLEAILQKIEEMNENRLEELNVDKPITFSVGIASVPEDIADETRPWSAQLLENADVAALWAKHNGKNQHCLYDLKRKDEFIKMATKITIETKKKALKGERS